MIICFVLRTAPLVSWFHFALHIYIYISVFLLFSHLVSLSQEAWNMSNYSINSCVQVYARENPLHYKPWWQWFAKDSCFKELLFSVNKRGMNCEYKLDIHADHIGTLWEYIYTLQIVSFLVFCVLGRKMHPWHSDAIFGTSAHVLLCHQCKNDAI